MSDFHDMVRKLGSDPAYVHVSDKYHFSSKSHAIVWLMNHGKDAMHCVSSGQLKAQMLVAAITMLDGFEPY